MVSKSKHTAGKGNGSFRIEGEIQLEKSECESSDVKLFAYVFDKSGAEYKEEKIIDIYLNEATVLQRIILFLRQIEYKLLKAINSI